MSYYDLPCMICLMLDPPVKQGKPCPHHGPFEEIKPVAGEEVVDENSTV